MMSCWIQTYDLSVPTYRTTNDVGSRRRQKKKRTGSTGMLFQIALSAKDPAATREEERSFTIIRPMAAFHALRDELLRLTKPTLTGGSAKTVWMRRVLKKTGSHSCCTCESSAPCPFQSMHEAIRSIDPLLMTCTMPRSRFRRLSNPDAVADTQRAAVERWMQGLHAGFARYNSVLLQSKYQRDTCAVLNTYAAFLNARAHFRVMDASALRQPLALRGWRAERVQAVTEAMTLIDEDQDKDEDDDREHELPTPKSEVRDEGSTLLPRLDVKRVGLATLQTFLEDFCETLLTQYGQDIAELRSPELTMARRWELCLYVACRIGHSYGAQLILFYYAEANVALDDGTTCLHIAARMGRAPIVTLLLQEGADVNTPNNNGITPLIAACRNGYGEVVKLLLDAGASVNVGTERGTQALHAAIVSHSPEIVQMLLSAGADVRATTESGLSPLHFAVQLGSVELTQLLLKHNADPEQQTESGSDAMAIATTNGHMEICELFQKEMDRKNMLASSGSKLFQRFKKTATAASASSASQAPRNSSRVSSVRERLESNDTIVLLSDQGIMHVDELVV